MAFRLRWIHLNDHNQIAFSGQWGDESTTAFRESALLSVMSKSRSSLVVVKTDRRCEFMPHSRSLSPLGIIFLWSVTNFASIALDRYATPEKSKRR